MSPVMDEVSKQTSELHNLSSERKAMLVFLVLVLFGASYLVGTYISKNNPANGPIPANQDTSQQTTEATQPAAETVKTMLTLTSSESQMSVGKEATVSVTLSKKPVSAIDVTLTYDPTLITVSSIKNGDVFGKVLKKPIAAGTLRYVATINPGEKDNVKEGAVFSFTVMPKKESAQATIVVDPQKTKAALGGNDIMVEGNGLTFSIIQ